MSFDAHSVLSWLLVNGHQALRADLSNGVGQIMVIGLEALKVPIVPTSLVDLSEEKNLECDKLGSYSVASAFYQVACG